MFQRRDSAIDSSGEASILGCVRQTLEPCQQLHLNEFLVVQSGWAGPEWLGRSRVAGTVQSGWDGPEWLEWSRVAGTIQSGRDDPQTLCEGLAQSHNTYKSQISSPSLLFWIYSAPSPNKNKHEIVLNRLVRGAFICSNV